MLSDTAVRKLKPQTKPLKLFDERGLFLLVSLTGSKLWRFKYRIHGREKLISLGAYPDVTLARARELRDQARALVARGIDPSLQRKAQRRAGDSSFEAIAREWFEKFKPSWSATHARTVIARLENDVFPFIGSRPIAEVSAPELLSVLRKMESRGVNESAHKVRQICGQVWRFAISSGRAERDPSADLRGALAPVETRHFAAVTDPKQAAPLLRILDGYDGTLIVRCALRLAPLVFLRPGELRQAEWAEIDLKRARWVIPPWRMKMRQPLIVPLSCQAVDILRELHPVTGHGRFVFPSARSGDRPMSDNAILAALRRSGVERDTMTGHGFRALARTILDEELGVRVDLIEAQLGHAVKDANGRAYNRTSFIVERTKMMQQWADYLDGLKAAKASTVAAKQA